MGLVLSRLWCPHEKDRKISVSHDVVNDGKKMARDKSMWYNTAMNKQTVILIALAFIVIMNIASFCLMGHDKRCARQGKWRVPEKRLFLVTACFGGLGGVLGMKVFRHKTQHWYFKFFFPVLLVLQIALLAGGAYFLFRS